MKNKSTVLKTKRLVLTPLTDAQLRERLDTEPDAGMRKALGDMLAGCESFPASRLWYTEWRAEMRDCGDIVGSLCFKGPPDENGEAEIGYGIDTDYRGQGFAAEAAKALIGWTFNQAEGLFFVMAETAPDNAASMAVLKKLGFSKTGRDGEEGPRFELERPAENWMSIFMCLGLSVGMCLGLPFDNMTLGMCLGIAIGVAMGAAMDAENKKKRAAVKAAREAAYSAGKPDERE